MSNLSGRNRRDAMFMAHHMCCSRAGSQRKAINLRVSFLLKRYLVPATAALLRPSLLGSAWAIIRLIVEFFVIYCQKTRMTRGVTCDPPSSFSKLNTSTALRQTGHQRDVRAAGAVFPSGDAGTVHHHFHLELLPGNALVRAELPQSFRETGSHSIWSLLILPILILLVSSLS